MFTLIFVFTNTHGLVPLCSIMLYSVFYSVFTLIFVFTNTRGPRYAVLLLNNNPNETNVTCDVHCVGAMNLPDEFPDTVYTRDLWAHAPATTIVNLQSDNGFSVLVPGGGASVLLKLCDSEEECLRPVLPPPPPPPPPPRG
jgi:hypothetical protein